MSRSVETVLRESLVVFRESLVVLRESLVVLRESLVVLRESLVVLDYAHRVVLDFKSARAPTDVQRSMLSSAGLLPNDAQTLGPSPAGFVPTSNLRASWRSLVALEYAHSSPFKPPGRAPTEDQRVRDSPPGRAPTSVQSCVS